MSPAHLKRVGIQLCYPFSESRLFNRGRLQSTWIPPWLTQRKLNGERCRALVQTLENGFRRVLLLSSTEELITTLPHINAAMLQFPDGEYDGELYVHGWKWSEIHSVVSTINTQHPDAHLMEYHLFDIITEGQIQAERTILLNTLWQRHHTGPIHLVPSHPVTSLEDIMSFYDIFISEGYEGFVLRELSAFYIRRRSPYNMKFKPKKRDTYKILSVYEAISESGQPLNMVGGFVCVDPEGTEFRVGAGKLTHPERRDLWHRWNNRSITNTILFPSRLQIEYQTLSDAKGVPHFSRAVKLL